jgi:hypothetical protein
MGVPVEFFESVIGIELAITGALLFEIRYFEPRGSAERENRTVPRPWALLVMAVVLGVTVFGSLYAIGTGGQRSAAIGVTIGLAISLLPILLRVLPPLTAARQDAAVTVVGLAAYGILVTIVSVLLNG